MDLRATFTPPTVSLSGLGPFPVGTDQPGRDILSRVMAGSRITLIVAASAVVLGGTTGITPSLAAGDLGGWADRNVIRLADYHLTKPLLPFARTYGREGGKAS